MRRERKPFLKRVRDLAVDALAAAEVAVHRPPPDNTEESFRVGAPFVFRRGMLIAFGVVLAVSVAVFARYVPPLPPTQPVPFSHRFHVGTKKLDCMFCHNSAARSSNAGMPPVQKCLLCHNVIASNFWPIARLRDYAAKNKPVPWKWVNKVPDYVHFKHQAHITRGIDCGYCHGNVAEMDIVRTAHKFDMNFCITCHWRNQGPDSCFVCHY
jgi:hypothetical protein